jgi:hypothetical protein
MVRTAENMAARAAAAKPRRPTPAMPASPPMRVSTSSSCGYAVRVFGGSARGGAGAGAGVLEGAGAGVLEGAGAGAGVGAGAGCCLEAVWLRKELKLALEGDRSRP